MYASKPAHESYRTEIITQPVNSARPKAKVCYSLVSNGEGYDAKQDP